MEQKAKYHGTCKYFLMVAIERGALGPDGEEVSFTPELRHARTFAEDWAKPRGLRLLTEYFGESIDKKLAEPVILEFNREIKGLKFRRDCGADEYYVEKGPVDISGVRIIL